MDTLQATEYSIFLSCPREENFRTSINPEYKANRPNEKPKHYEFIKKHLIEHWKAHTAIGEEADDLIGINLDEDSVACSIDKDILYGLVGNKYDFVKDQQYYTSEEEAERFFYKQLLMGDRTDNIPGIFGIGPAKADKLLAQADSTEYLPIVIEAYKKSFSDMSEEEIIAMITKNGQQLKIRTYIGEIWQPPNGQKED